MNTSRLVRRPVWAVMAFVFGGLGLVGAVFGHDVAERISPRPPVEERVADTVVRVRDAVVAKLKDRDAKITPAPPAPTLHGKIARASLALAVLGILGAAVAYSRREDRRIAVVAGAVAVVGLAWHVMMIALGVAVLLVIVALVTGGAGVDVSI